MELSGLARHMEWADAIVWEAGDWHEVGGEPPITDFIAWVWWGQPPAAWPLLDQQA